MPRSLHALVDYFNVAGLPAHRRPTYDDHRNALDTVVSGLLRQTRGLKPRPASLRLRLYGGWHDEQTDDYTDSRQELGVIARRHFPTGRQPSRVFVHMADGLMALPGHELRHTLRLWSGLPPFQVRRPTNCRDPDDCPLADLKTWRRNRCPRQLDCGVTSREALSIERQKLVDTALVADTLHLARHCESDWVAVVSNDDDILPGLLAGAADHGRLLLVTVSRTKPSSYADLLARISVGYLPLDDRS